MRTGMSIHSDNYSEAISTRALNLSTLCLQKPILCFLCAHLLIWTYDQSEVVIAVAPSAEKFHTQKKAACSHLSKSPRTSDPKSPQYVQKMACRHILNKKSDANNKGFESQHPISSSIDKSFEPQNPVSREASLLFLPYVHLLTCTYDQSEVGISGGAII